MKFLRIVPMNSVEPTLIDRRHRVGWTAIVCLGVAAIGVTFAEKDSVWPAAALRVGIVLGALWLCFPTKTRPAAWAALTNGRMVALVIATLMWNRIKYFMPFLAFAGLIMWFIRPRKK